MIKLICPVCGSDKIIPLYDHPMMDLFTCNDDCECKEVYELKNFEWEVVENVKTND